MSPSRTPCNTINAFSLALLFVAFAVAVAVPSSTNDFYYQHWCGKPNSLYYLDDSACVKRFPSNISAGVCSVRLYESEQDLPKGYSKDAPFTSIKPDTTLLTNFVKNGVNLCLILTKRVLGQPNTTYNKYFCVGDYSVTEPYETWSSSKIFAVANAAGTLRGREPLSTSCPAAALGIDSATSGKDGPNTALADLATIICSYDTTAGYSSNSLSSYFHDLGGRAGLDALIQSAWLANGTFPISLGGNYGEASPSDLVFLLTPTNATQECQAQKDATTAVYDNSLTALAAAELTRRLVLHSSIDASLRWPYLQQADVDRILRGSGGGAGLFPSQSSGGMSSDTSIFVQSSLDMEEVERKSNGTFRIYSKLGCGYSSSRERGEIVNNVYACLPNYGGDGGGLEITIAVRGSVPHDTAITKVEEVVLEAVQAVVQGVFDG